MSPIQIQGFNVQDLSRESFVKKAEEHGKEIESLPVESFSSPYSTEDGALAEQHKSFMKGLSKAKGENFGEIKVNAEKKKSFWEKCDNTLQAIAGIGGVVAMVGLLPTGFAMLGEIASVVLWPCSFNGLNSLPAIFPALLMGGGGALVGSVVIGNVTWPMKDKYEKFTEKLDKWGDFLQQQHDPHSAEKPEARAA